MTSKERDNGNAKVSFGEAFGFWLKLYVLWVILGGGLAGIAYTFFS